MQRTATPPAPAATASVQIAPNPVSGNRIGVTAVLAKAAPVKLELVDISGAVASRDPVPGHTGANRVSLSTEGSALGVYVVWVTAGEESLSRQVVVV